MRLFSSRVVAALAAVVLVAALATVIVRATGDDSKHVASQSTSTTSSSSTTTSTAPPPPGTPAPPPSPATTPVPPAQARIFNEIRDQVAELRGLPWKAPLDIQVANDAEFVRQLQAVIARDQHLDRMQGDGETLKVLKLIPQNLDYIKLYNDLLNGAVLGFYDPKTKKLLVRSSGSSLSPEERITIAHEMDHALTDQHFNYGPATDQLDQADKGEQGSGYSALLEGDAKLLEAMWAQKYLSAKERAQASGEAGGSSDVYRRTPPFVVDSLLFPYTTGRSFVAGRYQAGGWAAVNAIYGRPPDSTQVVIHPNLYMSGKTWSTPAFPNLA